jgi:hypothetical protein
MRIPNTQLGRLAATAAAAFVSIAITACDQATGIESLDDAMTIDAAVLAADGTIEELALFHLPLDFTGFIPGEQTHPAGPHSGPHGGPGGMDGGLAGVRSVTFYDVDGVIQEAYDALETGSVVIAHEIEGTIVRDRFTAQVSRARALTVTGLAGEETQRTWNGSGSSSMARSGVTENGAERSHSAEESFTLTDVVVPIPGSENRWPISGTVTRHMVMTRTSSEGTTTREVDIEVTFDGSSTATALVNGQVVEIDLATLPGRHPLRRRHG